MIWNWYDNQWSHTIGFSVGWRGRMNLTESRSKTQKSCFNRQSFWYTFQGTGISHECKRKLIFSTAFEWDMLAGYILPRLHEFYQLRHWLSPDALPFLELTAEKHLEVCRFLVLEADCQLLLKETGRPTEFSDAASWCGVFNLSKCISTKHNQAVVVDTKSCMKLSKS